MKKLKFFVVVLIVAMSSTLTFAAEDVVKLDIETLSVSITESKIMGDEISIMNERLEEIRDMDKSELSNKDKKELKKKLRKTNGGIYIGGATLILVVILIAILV